MGMVGLADAAVALVPVLNRATVIFRFGVAFGVALLVGILLITRRERLPQLLETRNRRVIVEALAACLPIATAVLIELSDLKEAWEGTAPSDADPWLWALAIVAAASALAIVAASLAHEVTLSERDKLITALRADYLVLLQTAKVARDKYQFHLTVNGQFLRVVSRKRERLKRLKAPRMDEIADALNPWDQGEHLIIACWTIFNEILKLEPGGEQARLRVAYFRVHGPRLEPRYCWNGTAGDCVSLAGGSVEVRSRFDLSSSKDCSAKVVAKTGRTEWVPSTAKIGGTIGYGFTFFEESEKQSLKSMVAAPVKIEGETGPFDVITIDTDLEGFFEEAKMSDPLHHVLDNLAYRLHLEREMERLFTEGKHGTTAATR